MLVTTNTTFARDMMRMPLLGDGTRLNPLGLHQEAVYVVHAMSSARGALKALLVTEDTHVGWVRFDVLHVVDGGIPSSWRFAHFLDGSRDPVSALWGYASLIDDPQHLEDLIVDKRKLAFRTFLAEIDREDLPLHEGEKLARLAHKVAPAR